MSDGKIRVAPIARRLAEEAGIDLATLTGSGPGGRIVRADVEAAARDSGPVDDAAAALTGARAVPASRTQATIAKRMAAAKANVPEFVVARELDAGPLLALREELRGAGLEPLPSLNDLVVRAVALTLREHPELNASYADAEILLHERVNVGIAVAAERTLLVPTLFDADQMPLATIAAEARRLAAAARDGTISPSELEGGTFTVSNLGGFGATRFVAIVNEPQAAILAVGAAVPSAVVSADGELAAGHRMELTLTADHRIVYGAEAARFLASLAERLAAPAELAA